MLTIYIESFITTGGRVGHLQRPVSEPRHHRQRQQRRPLGALDRLPGQRGVLSQRSGLQQDQLHDV